MVKDRVWLLRVQALQPVDHVACEAELHVRNTHDCLRALIKHLPQAAAVGKLHEQADPLRVVKHDAQQLHDVGVRDLLKGLELATEQLLNFGAHRRGADFHSLGS